MNKVPWSLLPKCPSLPVDDHSSHFHSSTGALHESRHPAALSVALATVLGYNGPTETIKVYEKCLVTLEILTLSPNTR